MLYPQQNDAARGCTCGIWPISAPRRRFCALAASITKTSSRATVNPNGGALSPQPVASIQLISWLSPLIPP